MARRACAHRRRSGPWSRSCRPLVGAGAATGCPRRGGSRSRGGRRSADVRLAIARPARCPPPGREETARTPRGALLGDPAPDRSPRDHRAPWRRRQPPAVGDDAPIGAARPRAWRRARWRRSRMACSAGRIDLHLGERGGHRHLELDAMLADRLRDGGGEQTPRSAATGSRRSGWNGAGRRSQQVADAPVEPAPLPR